MIKSKGGSVWIWVILIIILIAIGIGIYFLFLRGDSSIAVNLGNGARSSIPQPPSLPN